MELIRLTADYKMKPFDCGDTELNGFLLDDAKFYLKQKIANTFILEEESRVVACPVCRFPILQRAGHRKRTNVLSERCPFGTERLFSLSLSNSRRLSWSYSVLWKKWLQDVNCRRRKWAYTHHVFWYDANPLNNPPGQTDIRFSASSFFRSSRVVPATVSVCNISILLF